MLKSLDDSQQRGLKRNTYIFKSCVEILHEGNAASFLLSTCNLTTDWTQSFSTALPPFPSSLLLVLISSPSSSWFLSLLSDRLCLAPASACRCQQQPMLPKDNSNMSAVECQLPLRARSQVAWLWSTKHRQGWGQRQVSRGYGNSLSTGWTSVEPQSESKASLLWPLAHNFPPQNLPRDIPSTVGFKPQWNTLESFGKICSVGFEGRKRQEILSQLEKELALYMRTLKEAEP